MDYNPSDYIRNLNGAYASRGRPIFGGMPRSRSFSNFNRDESPEASARPNPRRGFPNSNEEAHSNPPGPNFVYYPPPPDPVRDFHTVPVLSGPFPISHIPGAHPLSGRFNDVPIVLGPFLLHNIPLTPGTIPIHHVPYIPRPENIPHCPVLYEADELNDINLTFPGYTILVPVPFGAQPAVEIYIIPSGYIDGPKHVLIFQHGYIMPPQAHFVYVNTRDARFGPEGPPHAPNVPENGRREEGPPVLGMRIGRQPSPPTFRRGGRGRIYNGMRHNLTFRYAAARGFRRRPFGRNGFYREPRAHSFDRRVVRPLHSCGSNDPAHNCLWDQPRRRAPVVAQPVPITILRVPEEQEEKKGEAAKPVQPPIVLNPNTGGEIKIQPGDAATTGVRIPIQQIIILKPARLSEEMPARKSEEKPDTKNVEAAPGNEAAAPGNEAAAPLNEAAAPGNEAAPPPPEDPVPEEEIPKKKGKGKKTEQPEPEGDPGEGTSSTKRRSRYRPTYNYLRNPKRGDAAPGEKVKIRNYDKDGNRVPTYRQAVHYCTKYHEKQSRKKLRKQRRAGLFAEERRGERTLLDDWLGDCSTTDSDSDSSFLTDEGGDPSNPPNSKQMLEYYYEIKALKEEEKKKKKK